MLLTFHYCCCVYSMLKYQPTHRLTAADALMHPYMSSLVHTLPHYTEESIQQIHGESENEATSREQRYPADHIVGMRTVTPTARSNAQHHTTRVGRCSKLAEQRQVESHDENRENERNRNLPQFSSASPQRRSQEHLHGDDDQMHQFQLNNATEQQVHVLPTALAAMSVAPTKKTIYYDFGCKLTIPVEEFEFEDRKLTYDDLREELLYEGSLLYFYKFYCLLPVHLYETL